MKDTNIEDNHTKTSAPEEDSIIRSESRLELQGLSNKEKRRILRARLKETLKDMTKWQKFCHITYYYKWHFIISSIIIFCMIFIPISIYKNSRPVAISYVIINAKDPTAIDTSFTDDYKEQYNKTKGYRIVERLDLHLDKETYLTEFSNNADGSDYTRFPMECFNGLFDFIISDQKGIDYCAMQEIISPVNLYFEDYVYTYIDELCYESANSYDEKYEYAIDISHTEFAKNLNLDYDKVYLAFPGTTKDNYEGAKLILNYILDVPQE